MSKKRRRELAELCGSNIRAARKAAGLSQVDLSARWRVAQTYIARIERADVLPSLETLDRAARAIGVSLVQLVTPPRPDKKEPKK